MLLWQVFSLPALYQQACRIHQQASDLSGVDADNIVKVACGTMHVWQTGCTSESTAEVIKRL